MDLQDYAMHHIRKLLFQYLDLEFNEIVTNTIRDLWRSFTNPEHKPTRKAVVKECHDLRGCLTYKRVFGLED
jgi:hypothetical protein